MGGYASQAKIGFRGGVDLRALGSLAEPDVSHGGDRLPDMAIA